MFSVRFQGDPRTARAGAGETILAAARAAGIPLTHSCGGTGACSTCRVLVVEGAGSLGPPTPQEAAMARLLRFPENVRLGCQARVLGDVEVRALVRDEADESLVESELASGAVRAAGELRRVAILFSDVRGFTAFSEQHAAYDVIHLLNRWYARVTAVVHACGGRVDNFIGDGVMAVFGEASPESACEDAVRAALGLSAAAREVSAYACELFGTGWRIGVGIHWGDAVLGAVGAGERRRITAIGDTVNLAARIEAATRNVDAEILVTREVRRELGARLRTGKTVSIHLKGKTGEYELTEVLGLDDAGGDREAGAR